MEWLFSVLKEWWNVLFSLFEFLNQSLRAEESEAVHLGRMGGDTFAVCYKL